MRISEIASVSGKGSLYKVVSPTKSGIILEALDGTKAKLVTSANSRISLLHEISIYTTTKEGTIPLAEVLKKIYKEYKDDTGVDANSDGAELKAFMKTIVPEFDEERVYISDLKKLVKWYAQLYQHAPEVLQDEATAGETSAPEASLS